MITNRTAGVLERTRYEISDELLRVALADHAGIPLAGRTAELAALRAVGRLERSAAAHRTLCVEVRVFERHRSYVYHAQTRPKRRAALQSESARGRRMDRRLRFAASRSPCVWFAWTQGRGRADALR